MSHTEAWVKYYLLNESQGLLSNNNEIIDQRMAMTMCLTFSMDPRQYRPLS